MNDGDAYLLARLVSAVFGRRNPSCGLAAFVLIVVGVIALFLLRAKSLDDVAFPVIALGFLAALGLGQAVRYSRRRSVIEPEPRDVDGESRQPPPRSDT